MQTQTNQSAYDRAMLAYNRRVEKRNLHFKGLSRLHKRLTILWDLWDRLRLGTFRPAHGRGWLEMELPAKSALLTEGSSNGGLQVQAILPATECTGCALGGFMLCLIDRKNKIRLEEFEGWTAPGGTVSVRSGEDVRTYFTSVFTKKELAEIEVAFESGSGHFSGSREAANFVIEVDQHVDELRLIVENMIVHDSDFRPEVKSIFKGRKWTTPGFSRSLRKILL